MEPTQSRNAVIIGMFPDLNDLALYVHLINQKWWHDLDGVPLDRDVGEMLMLIVSEVAEAMEGRRKSLMDDKLPHRAMAEVELADTCIRILDTLGSKKFATDGFDVNAYVVLLRDGHEHHMRNEFMEGTDGKALLMLSRLIVYAWDTYSHGGSLGRPLARVLYACELLAKRWHYDLYGSIDEKNAYNITRADHQLEARKQEHGKKW